MDGYADDLAAVIEVLGLKSLAHQTLNRRWESGALHRAAWHEAGRRGRPRRRIPPIMVKSAANPEGLPAEVSDKLRSDLSKNPSQFYTNLATPFYGAKRPGENIPQGTLDQFWLRRMQARSLPLCTTVTSHRRKTTKSLAVHSPSFPARRRTFSPLSSTPRSTPRQAALGFAHFDKDGTPGDEAFMKSCSPCHGRARASDLVFTHYAP